MKKDYITAPNDFQDDDLTFVDKFWSQRWDNNVNLPSAEIVASREELHLMLPFLEKAGKGAHVLDAGCGMGEWTAFLNQQGYQTVGLDISDSVIKKLQSMLPQYEFIRADIRKTGYPDEFFDALFSWGAFEHFENGPSDCLKESFRILKPGGYLFITVPFDNWRHIRTRMRSVNSVDTGVRNNSSPMHFYQWRFMKSEIEQEIILAGFNPVWVKPVSKAEGVSRWLEWNMKITPASGLYNLLFNIANWLLPSNYVAHMLMVAARKPESS